MDKASGFAVFLMKHRMDTFRECVAEERKFAEPVADFQHSRTAPLVCFVVNAGKLSHIGLGRRGVRAGTGLSRLNIDKAEELSEPLSVRKLLNRLPKRNAASIRKRFQSGGGLLTEKGFSAVVETICQLAPQASGLLNRFSETRTDRIRRISDKTPENLAQQTEALLTALSIAGLRRDPVQEWAPSEEAPVSFLDGLLSVRLREDPMVVNDLQNLPGFEVVKTYPYGMAVFESEETSERLTYDNAKRHFDNTAFTTVVSKAWVGTTPSQSQVLQGVIRETRKTGKAVAIAIKPKKPAEQQADDEEIAEEALDD